MTGGSKRQWNMDEIEAHLKSAVDTLTPDVLDRIDLSTPQDQPDAASERPGARIIPLRRRMRALGSVLAACLCVICLAGGITTVQNRRVSSVIGIDVNPSVELSVNRNDRVLKAKPLNGDAVEILGDMDLEGVDLNVAVNALIGSMVKHGYLDDLDNAILVTVSNDDKEKAANMRQSVVGDIERSLAENQIHAVVYDQQAEDEDDVKELAEKYGISYGKAYFLKELIDLNENLSEADMEGFAGMTMEEIAKEITERSYELGEKIDKTKDPTQSTTQESTTVPETEETTEAVTTTEAETTVPETTPPETSAPETTAPVPETTTAAPTEETTEEEVGSGSVRIDNVDFDAGTLEVDFEGKVKWKNPTVSVEDSDGASYPAKITDKGNTSCQIEITGLAGGKEYTFIISGIGPKEGGKYTSVKGRFEAPDISDEATEAPSDDTEDETKESAVPSESSPADQSSEAESSESRETEESSTEEKTSAEPSEAQSPPENSEDGGTSTE